MALEKISGQGRYAFDKDGIIKDMIASHLYNLYTSITGDLEEFEKIEEKYCGQYDGYEFENSNTKTLSYIKCTSKKGYVVHFIAGKSLASKQTIIEIKFQNNKKLQICIYPKKEIIFC